MNSYLTSKIEELSPMRSVTMQTAVASFIERGGKSIVETGCYRGISGDGFGTLLLAQLAEQVDGHVTSIEINPDNLLKAQQILEENNLSNRVTLIHGDSVRQLSILTTTIDLLYLDSYDYIEADPGPCQRHQLAELGAAFGKLAPRSLVLMDDFDLPSRGKCGLSVEFLLDRGAVELCRGYQILFSMT